MSLRRRNHSLGKLASFMGLFFRGGEETARGLSAAYATVAEACGALSWMRRASSRRMMPGLTPSHAQGETRG
jgi:hypothetical protein